MSDARPGRPPLAEDRILVEVLATKVNAGTNAEVRRHARACEVRHTDWQRALFAVALERPEIQALVKAKLSEMGVLGNY